MPLHGLEREVHARGLRFVAFSRPGYGGSTRLAGRSVADVVPDVEAVLDRLRVDRCLVAGWSGGGPHALACAARVDRVAAALGIATVAPFGQADLDFLAGMGEDNIAEFDATAKGEGELRLYLEALRPEIQTITPDGIVGSMSTLLPEVDKAALTDEFADDLAASFHESVRISVDGWLDDDLAFIRDWGFELEEIRVPTALWQGSEDKMVPFTHGEWFAKHLPQATVHLEAGEGHLSIGLGAIDRMLDELVAAAG